MILLIIIVVLVILGLAAWGWHLRNERLAAGKRPFDRNLYKKM